MTRKKKPKKEKSDFSLRDYLIAEILPAYHGTVGNPDFKELFDQQLRQNKRLIALIQGNQHDPLVYKRMILGHLPIKAVPIVRLLIRELLLAGNQEN
jgi:hypothetical protein